MKITNNFKSRIWKKSKSSTKKNLCSAIMYRISNVPLLSKP